MAIDVAVHIAGTAEGMADQMDSEEVADLGSPTRISKHSIVLESPSLPWYQVYSFLCPQTVTRLELSDLAPFVIVRLQLLLVRGNSDKGFLAFSLKYLGLAIALQIPWGRQVLLDVVLCKEGSDLVANEL
ncbi:unnamed protein product [Prunus armeniaca]